MLCYDVIFMILEYLDTLDDYRNARLTDKNIYQYMMSGGYRRRFLERATQIVFGGSIGIGILFRLTKWKQTQDILHIEMKYFRNARLEHIQHRHFIDKDNIRFTLVEWQTGTVIKQGYYRKGKKHGYWIEDLKSYDHDFGWLVRYHPLNEETNEIRHYFGKGLYHKGRRIQKWNIYWGDELVLQQDFSYWKNKVRNWMLNSALDKVLCQ